MRQFSIICFWIISYDFNWKIVLILINFFIRQNVWKILFAAIKLPCCFSFYSTRTNCFACLLWCRTLPISWLWRCTLPISWLWHLIWRCSFSISWIRCRACSIGTGNLWSWLGPESICRLRRLWGLWSCRTFIRVISWILLKCSINLNANYHKCILI